MFRRAVEAVVATRQKWFLAAACLVGILFIGFAPALVGGRTLLLASWDSPSITSHGAYDPFPRPAGPRAPRTPDPGAAAWQTEAWFGLIADQFWSEFDLPLWNPYNGYGKPLLGAAQPQPFFPLATLLSLHLTAWTYNLFHCRAIVARWAAGAPVRAPIPQHPSISGRGRDVHDVRLLHRLSQHAASERRRADAGDISDIRAPGETQLVGCGKRRCGHDPSRQHRRHAGIAVFDRRVRILVFCLPCALYRRA